MTTTASRTIHHDQLSLYTETFGKTNNTPVLLIAGAMAPASFWPDFFCQRLADDGYFVIRFDNRDFGQSTHFPQATPESEIVCPYTIFDMVDDCCRILDAYGIDQANIVGHSLGGSIAQLLTTHRSERVRTMTTISSPLLTGSCPDFESPDPEIEKKTWDVMLSNPMHPDPERGVPAFLEVWRYLNGDLSIDEAMANAYTATIYETETIAPAWNHMAVQNDLPDLLDRFQASNIPMLFMHGEKDALVQNQKNAITLAKHLNAHAHVIPNAGHLFFNKPVWDEIRIVLQEQFKRTCTPPSSNDTEGDTP